MEPNELLEMLKRYTDSAIVIRGEVINRCISLEIFIEDFIANHFCKELPKTIEFKQFFFWNASMGFGRKREILMEIIKKHNPDILTSHSSIDADLKDIITCRNRLAHSNLDFSASLGFISNKKEISVLNLKTAKVVIYSESEINRIITLCNKYTVLFYNGSK